ncbi:MAG: hypothetical protein A3C43_00710 [Candidatus Schekmanbacteria bacterium RIFCSPHIGHO2_02_FULL_38_11]|uniref:4Fe-4S ferredoxin-type domain-containing protein n=1 Tax=Candidatus Schekmanbacteria bacterium RIFCSPLOWO2_12_FULL_38_15 TaxID=1817883 RepID=A0A1F7SHM7_9BACT|nr:MAG: hypothetical protein A2043_05215 [Candidatus Schekmanbacteria bacterium GWA2_38_9]OGL51337.1 MAG: hypothetical protein A3H37_00285 [Candidatus Schekmanbacteria bacterium RIFCSPLOWO2_02_FULL_38_14]OGL53300.1 MAG: hypothetical protein A3G31_07255 [Candidatus Schekmanbacteria bacterium RIFCSPLOWO2_12_FULL_38_15]OGL55659.1 MAG: hypothetical protein A3C43_00710 [Candidatus Schekmanbacteria bacterium RIFCSPHIGHO2_02_FULL_38_11]
MALKVIPEKCIVCCACEMACGYYHDQAFTTLSSSIIIYRAMEKKNYFGMMVKRPEDILIGRPESVEAKRPGDFSSGGGAASASAKPIFIRPTCDLCAGADEYNCVMACPTGALVKE